MENGVVVHLPSHNLRARSGKPTTDHAKLGASHGMCYITIMNFTWHVIACYASCGVQCAMCNQDEKS